MIIDVNGVGYQIKTSLTTFSALPQGERCRLQTYLHIKEDAHTLYGFMTSAEKDLFLLLISISGVGPNTGLTILSSLTVEEVQQAILREDVRTIQQVKGIGSKTAQRIILELRDKIKKETLTSDAAVLPSSTHNTVRAEALSALVTLGFVKNVAEKTIDAIIKRESRNLSVEELIKFALKSS